MAPRPRSTSEAGAATSAETETGGRLATRSAGGRAGRASAFTGGLSGRRSNLRRGGRRASEEPTTRELILTAAAAAFAERGYCGVNLADVVEELGFTKGALYFYFPNKESLATEIVQRHAAAWDPLVPAAIKETDDYLEALVTVTHRVAESFQSDPIARAGTRLSAERNIIKAELPQPFVGWIAKLTELLRKALDAGQLQEGVDPKSLARLVVSFFYGAQAVADQLTGRDDLHKRLDVFWELLLPQIRAKGSGGRARSQARAR